MSLAGGQLVVQALACEGARTVFTVPGESFLPVLDALYDHRAQIETVSHRHESAAGLAADGYAQAVEHDRKPFVTGEEGRRTLELVLAIYESSRRGEPVWIGKLVSD